MWQFIMRVKFYNNLNEFSRIFYIANEEQIVYIETFNVYREYYNNPSNDYGRVNKLNSVINDFWSKSYDTIKEYHDVVLS